MLYNGMDERIQVVTTPAIGAADTRVYLYDLDHRIVGEYGATGTADIKAEYIWLMPEVGATGPTGGDDGLGGYMPLATAVGQAGTLNWLHTHHHGAPILTTNATGTVVPYPAHAVLGFPGQFANSQQLAGAQHYYNRYRDYDVNTGRYIQADPIGLAGDDNPYLYAGGNPLRYMDPLGLKTIWEGLTGLPDSTRTSAMNVIAGVSDSATLGATYWIRQQIGANREIDKCSSAYRNGEAASLVLGGARLAYAGTAKLGAALARNGEAASQFRNGLKGAFRGTFSRAKFRIYPYKTLLEKYGSDQAVKAAAGRTDPLLNWIGAAAVVGGSTGLACGCR
jgi:RHS repeat-associated protein